MDKKNKRLIVIVCAKKNSIRFPGKNRRLIDDVLTELEQLDVVLATDDKSIVSGENVKFIYRPKNAAVDEDSVFNVARWAYYCLDEAYDNVAVILPNVIDFNIESLYECYKLLNSRGLNEVRTYDSDGVENGVIMMKTKWFLEGNLSVYCGAVTSSSKEIHYKSELAL